MKSMKRTPESKEKAANLAVPEALEGEYPYGLRINLGRDEIKRLGIKPLPKVGITVTLEAKCKVISVSQNERQGGSPDQRVELQITHMEIATQPRTMEEAVDEGISRAG